MFRFKQFTVHHDRCAMKVGMDGSLLGAWSGEGLTPSRILDIGTGTGLIALMVAQRFEEADITGIDIQKGCMSQAQENIDASPFSKRISLELESLQEHASPGDLTYDLIVCNPPFFNRSSQSDQSDRNTARHDDSLPFPELIANAAKLLTDRGIFSVIIPDDRAREFMEIAESHSLHLWRSMRVYGRKGGPAKRRLIEFSKFYPKEAPQLTELAVEDDVRVWSEEYKALLREFYIVL